MKITQATALNEYLSVFSLIYETYLQRNYIKPNLVNLYLSAKHLEPETQIWIGCKDDTVIITTSIFAHTDRSPIPSYEAFPDEITKLCQQQQRIGEVGFLASRLNSYKFLNNFLSIIYNIASRYLDTAIICCHPKHKFYYENIWKFEQIGEEKPIARVNNAPGILMATTFQTDKLPESIKETVKQNEDYGYLSQGKKLTDEDYKNLNEIYKMVLSTQQL